MTHREVQSMMRKFMQAKGYKPTKRSVFRKINRHNPRVDDVFHKADSEPIICEYKPPKVTKSTLLIGVGQALVSSALSGKRTYLVIDKDGYDFFLGALDKAPWLGLFVYDREAKKVIKWRKPVNINSLPKANPFIVEEVPNGKRAKSSSRR